MECPHCGVNIHEGFVARPLVVTKAGMPAPIGMEGGDATFWDALYMACPACKNAIIMLQKKFGWGPKPAFQVYPEESEWGTAPPEVPPEVAEDYNEAGAVLLKSPKASAALSRRCLQAVLRDRGYAQHDLVKAIVAVLATNTLPAALAQSLDVVRNIGNFAAHPMKDTNTGEILPVEPEEAEWNLEVLDGMFDFYYVQPARALERLEALNAKLEAAGKPPVRQPPA